MAKNKKCIVCKQEFVPSNFNQKVCSMACAIKFAKDSESKKEFTKLKEEKKVWSVRKKQMQEGIKTLTDYNNELQKEINKIVRLLDRGHECISSGRPLGAKFDAGHRYSRGAFPSIRFNLHNIWSQSVHDNQYLSGNVDGFRRSLIEKFGMSYFDYLESLKLQYPSLKLNKEELMQAKVICKEIIKELELEGYLTNEERLEYRYKLNKRIGIYK